MAAPSYNSCGCWEESFGPQPVDTERRVGPGCWEWGGSLMPDGPWEGWLSPCCWDYPHPCSSLHNLHNLKPHLWSNRCSIFSLTHVDMPLLVWDKTSKKKHWLLQSNFRLALYFPSHQDTSSEQHAPLNSRDQENYTKAGLRGLFHPKHRTVRRWSHRELNWAVKPRDSFA